MVAYGTAIQTQLSIRPAGQRRGRAGSCGNLRILFVTPYAPSRLRPRPFHLIRALAERGHHLTLISAVATERELTDLRALEPHCERVHGVRIPLARSLWSCARGLAEAEPLQARYCLSPHMTAAVRHALALAGGFDLLHVEHLRAALYADEAAGLPRVFDAVDCMSRLLAQTAGVGPTWSTRLTARVELPRTRRFERQLVRQFERILLTAETERAALLGLAAAPAESAARVHVLPNGVDGDYFPSTDAPRDAATLVFVGRMAYHANFAAARQLLTDLMPRLWARRPDARLLIVGTTPPAALRALARRAGPRVVVTGAVPDVRPYLRRATLSVSPLPYAVGIQNKVLEAMATATPVVATRAACSGLRAVPGQDLLVAEGADAFAAEILRLLEEPALARTVGAAGRRYVEAQHDWRAAARDLEAIYHDAIAERAAADGWRSSVGAA